MLDGDLYGTGSSADPGGSSGGGTSGGASSGGSGSLVPSAGGGNLNLPGSGGHAGNPSTPTAAVLSSCATYCPRYGTQCVARLGGQYCNSACVSEMTSFGATCQALGLKALACLTPFFTVNGAACDAAVRNALGKCAKEVNAFNTCKAKSTAPPR
jgi:hypothetical protein